jgi:hypothetical protein
MIHTGSDSPDCKCNSDTEDPTCETEYEKRYAHAEKTGDDQYLRPKPVSEDAARKCSNTEESIPDRDNRPERRRRDREFNEPNCD